MADVPATIMQSARAASSKQPSSTSGGIGSPNDTVSLFSSPSQCGQRGGSTEKSIASRPKRVTQPRQRISVALPWISSRRRLPASRCRLSTFCVMSARSTPDVLELDQRPMTGIGARRRERVPQLAHGTGRVQALLPGLARVGQEALEAVHRRLAVLRPQAARSAKRRDAALHRQPGARERDDVARPREAVGRRLERFAGLPAPCGGPLCHPAACRVNG